MKTLRANKTLLTLAVAMGASMIPALSHAQEVTTTQSSVYGGKLVQIGQASEDLTPLKGFAKDLPLITVMRQITPNGWIVKKNDNPDHPLDTQKPVSWQGGKTWVETLSDVAQNNQLNILVNWDKKEITLAPAKPNVDAIKAAVASNNANSSAGVFELNPGDKTTEVTHGASQQAAHDVAVAPTPVHVEPQPVKEVKLTATPVPTEPIRPVPTWNEDGSKTLRDNVRAWGQQAGYKVVWDDSTPDYPVDARVLSGDFTSNTGPIRQLAEDYGPRSSVKSPLSFAFYQNNTLVVTKWNFNQGNEIGNDSTIKEDLK
jgi:hypothetical protein